MKNLIGSIVVTFVIIRLIATVSVLHDQNNELKSMLSSCNSTGYYLAKTPVIDENYLADRSGFIVSEHY